MAFLNFDKQTVQSDKLFYIITAILFVVAVIVVFFTEGTNGSGDSVSHFMIAHFAWKHPYLFFDHWGKPLFTMLSSPFAFFGMKGLKLFNVLLSFTSLMIIHTLAKRFHHTKVLWILPIYFCAPEGVNVMFSGLTEPLFACLFALAVYLLVTKKQALAIVVVSFLPLSRSEGLIILIVFVLYFLIHKKFKLLPFFFVGQLVVSLLGYTVYHDIFWVFNKIPYATTETFYWDGPLFHYIYSMPHVFGIIATVLLYIGTIKYIFSFIYRLSTEKNLPALADYRFIIYGSFISFLFAHALFHYLGIFNDMGLTRVFIAMFPAMVLIALDGLLIFVETLTKWIKFNRLRDVLNYLLFIGMIYFGYVGSVYAMHFKNHFTLDNGQWLYKHQVIPYLDKYHSDKEWFYSDISIPYFKNMDIYETGRHAHEISKKKPTFQLTDDEIIIWDSWFSRVEEMVQKDSLLNHPHLELDTSFSAHLKKDTYLEVFIFKKKLRSSDK
jgi:hypothetical protein